MTLSEFILLQPEEKGRTALHQGILVGKRTTPGHFVFLFQLDHFYVELLCNLSTKEMETVNMAVDTSLLQPYLERIRIDDLLE